jgi:nucleotide sugar dehydrogenase
LLEAGGKRVDVDFDLAFSPERVKSKYVLKHLEETPKIVGGYSPKATARTAAFYQQYLGAPVIEVESLEASELVKLAGMVYRDVNIALSNEIERYTQTLGVELAPIIAAANTDGEAFLLAPGIGVGGHCTPVYPYFLAHDARRRGKPTAITELSRLINDSQPDEMVGRLETVVESLAGLHVLILGLGFRPGVKEHTCSPAFQVRDALIRRKAHVRLWDPLYTEDELRGLGFEPGILGDSQIPDALVLVTAHSEFTNVDFGALSAAGLKAVVDGRNLWNPQQVRANGLTYLGVGRKH